MRIGILTLPFNNNYGGYLQSYALMTILKRMGQDPMLLMRRHNKIKKSILFHVKFGIKGILKSVLKFKRYPIFFDEELYYRQSGRLMISFVNRYIEPQSPFFYTTEELKQFCEGRFDAYIVGSDQVWRPDYVGGVLYNLFLDFTKGWNVKRIAYAASFGTNKPYFNAEQIDVCSRLINSFDAISLRELSGREVFRHLGWRNDNMQIVLDPTMLLSKADYSALIPNTKSYYCDKIVSYVLDNSETIKYLQTEVSKSLNKNVISFDNANKALKPSIEEWLMAFRDCDSVITDSFSWNSIRNNFQQALCCCDK